MKARCVPRLLPCLQYVLLKKQTKVTKLIPFPTYTTSIYRFCGEFMPYSKNYHKFYMVFFSGDNLIIFICKQIFVQYFFSYKKNRNCQNLIVKKLKVKTLSKKHYFLLTIFFLV